MQCFLLHHFLAVLLYASTQPHGDPPHGTRRARILRGPAYQLEWREVNGVVHRTQRDMNAASFWNGVPASHCLSAVTFVFPSLQLAYIPTLLFSASSQRLFLSPSHTPSHAHSLPPTHTLSPAPAMTASDMDEKCDSVQCHHLTPSFF